MKRILAIALAFVMLLGTIPIFAFEVPTVKEAKDGDEKIEALKKEGLVEGFGDGDLGLDKSIKRSEITKLIVHALGEEKAANALKGQEAPFKDVEKDHWANGYIAFAKNAKNPRNGLALINGYPDGTFRPEKNVKVSELLKILVVMSKEDLTEEMIAGANWPADWVNWAKQENITGEDVGLKDWDISSDTLDQDAKREESFIALYNTVSNINVADKAKKDKEKDKEEDKTAVQVEPEKTIKKKKKHYHSHKPYKPYNPVKPNKPNKPSIVDPNRDIKNQLSEYIASINLDLIEKVSNDKANIKELKEKVKELNYLIAKKNLTDEEVAILKEALPEKIEGRDKMKGGLATLIGHNITVDWEVQGERTESANPIYNKKYPVAENEIFVKSVASKLPNNYKVKVYLNYVTKEDFNKVDLISGATPRFKKAEVPEYLYTVTKTSDGFKYTFNINHPSYEEFIKNVKLVKPIIKIYDVAKFTKIENGDLVFIKGATPAPDPTPAHEKVTVTFDSQGGTSVVAQEIEKGTTITAPPAPTKDGYTFKYWSLAENGTEFDFATAINENTTLYAVWDKNAPTTDPTPEKVTVTFDSQGGTSVTAQEIEKGTTITAPPAPTKDGYTFKYWSLEENGIEFNFATAINENITLYAVWDKNAPTTDPTPEKVTVTFDSKGGTSVAAQEIEKGTTITAPPAPTKDGYTFKYWSLAENGTEFVFSTAINKNTTLYAVWAEQVKVSTSDKKVEINGSSIKQDDDELVVNVDKGTDVTLKITPNKGTELERIELVIGEGDTSEKKVIKVAADNETDNSDKIIKNDDGTYTYRFKAEKATFIHPFYQSATYELTFTANTEQGEVKINDNPVTSGKYKYSYGAGLNFTLKPADKKTIKSFTVNGAEKKNKLEKNKDNTETYIFEYTIKENTDIEVVFEDKTYLINLKNPLNAEVNVATEAIEGAEIPVTLQDGYIFKVLDKNNKEIPVNDNIFTMPASEVTIVVEKNLVKAPLAEELELVEETDKTDRYLIVHNNEHKWLEALLQNKENATLKLTVDGKEKSLTYKEFAEFDKNTKDSFFIKAENAKSTMDSFSIKADFNKTAKDLYLMNSEGTTADKIYTLMIPRMDDTESYDGKILRLTVEGLNNVGEGFADAKYYLNWTGDTKITDDDPTLKLFDIASLEIIKPEKLEYMEGNAFDPNKVVIRAKDASEKTLDIPFDKFSEKDIVLKIDQKIITETTVLELGNEKLVVIHTKPDKTEVTAEKALTVTEKPFDKNSISEIEIIAPDKFEYTEGQIFDPSVLKVKLTDSFGKKVEVEFAKFSEYKLILKIDTTEINADTNHELEIRDSNINVTVDGQAATTSKKLQIEQSGDTEVIPMSNLKLASDSPEMQEYVLFNSDDKDTKEWLLRILDNKATITTKYTEKGQEYNKPLKNLNYDLKGSYGYYVADIRNPSTWDAKLALYDLIEGEIVTIKVPGYEDVKFMGMAGKEGENTFKYIKMLTKEDLKKIENK